ncbi:hypothetical protein ABZX75_24440 [Streptomyces sp. NPDC003038]|uniref:hypothetical protein n=1 Tax=unclassified Streptomyces TaxID=2593676 RepID=UPI0033AD9AAE
MLAPASSPAYERSTVRTTTQNQNIAAALSVTGGLELAHHLLFGVNDVNVRITTQLLGRHRGGYWLRQFCVPET